MRFSKNNVKIMNMTIDNNLIAYEYYKNLFVPKEVYTSGEKEETTLIDKYSQKNDMPILALEDDIIDPNTGKGLKKGFYNVIPDKYQDFLLIYQGGKLKAKIPVIETKLHETNNPRQPKIKKMSYSQYRKYQEKEYRKYLKGENPSEIDWKTAQIQYIPEKNGWLLIYNSNNITLLGIIKF